MTSGKSHGVSRARRLAGGLALVALSLMALLIWGKLKLVAGVPRTALADPNEPGRHVEAASPERD